MRILITILFLLLLNYIFSSNFLSKTKGDIIADKAIEQLGMPFVIGGGDYNGPTRGGFDCCGLTLYAIYQATGKEIIHNVVMQYKRCPKFVPISEAKRGDLIFYGAEPAGVNHVTIYIGDGRIIHAPRENKPIVTKKLDPTQLLEERACRYWE